MTHSTSTPSRRDWLRTIAAGAAGLTVAALARPASLFAFAQQSSLAMTVYKTPTCGCCTAWMDHVKANGFTANAQNVNDLTPIKRRFGVPRALESCHTALVGGYVVEGHVPADLVQKLLREKPNAVGLAVPGMPIGSPGMEGGRPQKYDVLLFDKAGKTTVYASR
ncbi:MAG TPA: DUF411 domain-containing protein [Gemmatimonadales bacterium]|nr:DUF411 domain-containing protein [Gemmatimonadales bacterium]